jgi:hypothetical protein
MPENAVGIRFTGKRVIVNCHWVALDDHEIVTCP